MHMHMDIDTTIYMSVLTALRVYAQSPTVDLNNQIGPLATWLVEIVAFAALCTAEQAKVFARAAITPDLGCMLLYHDGAGRDEYPHFDGRRVRFIVGLGTRGGLETVGESSRQDPNCSLNSPYGERERESDIVEGNDGVIVGNVLSAVHHAYVTRKLREAGVERTTATDGHALCRDVLSRSRKPRHLKSGGRLFALRSCLHRSAPRLGEAHLMDRRSDAYGDHVHTVKKAREESHDSRLVASHGRVRSVSLPFVDAKNGGGVPRIAGVHMACSGRRRATVVQLAGKPAFPASDATGSAASKLLARRQGGEAAESDTESSAAELSEEEEGGVGEDDKGGCEEEEGGGEEEADSEDREASGSSERTATLLCVNGAARSETALLQMALHERGIATISIEPAMQESHMHIHMHMHMHLHMHILHAHAHACAHAHAKHAHACAHANAKHAHATCTCTCYIYVYMHMHMHMHMHMQHATCTCTCYMHMYVHVHMQHAHATCTCTCMWDRRSSRRCAFMQTVALLPI